MEAKEKLLTDVKQNLATTIEELLDLGVSKAEIEIELHFHIKRTIKSLLDD